MIRRRVESARSSIPGPRRCGMTPLMMTGHPSLSVSLVERAAVVEQPVAAVVLREQNGPRIDPPEEMLRRRTISGD
jgi:hypothetical protein